MLVAEARATVEAAGAPSALAWVDFLDGELAMKDAPERARAFLEGALRRSREIRSALTEGIALVSLTTLRARHGAGQEALPLFSDAIRHWYDLDDWIHQRVTLGNLLVLLQRLGAHE